MRRKINDLFSTVKQQLSTQPDTAAATDDHTHRDYEADAEQLSQILMDEFAPDTVFHIGCGIGLHLKPFLDEGIEAYGVDGSDLAHERAVVPEEHITIADLSRPYTPDRDHDMVLCLDLLAHTPEEMEDHMVETIADAGDIAVISPTTTEQASFASQDTDYWIDKFENANMQYREQMTKRFKERINDIQWAPHNPMIFTRDH